MHFRFYILEFILSGLSSKCDVDELEKRWLICKDHEPSPMTLVSALLHNEEEVQVTHLTAFCAMFLSVIKFIERICPIEVMSFCFQVCKLNERLKMSRIEQRLGIFIVNHREDDFGENKLDYCQDLMCDISGKEPKTKEKIIELLKYLGYFDVLEQFNEWDLPKFPVNGIALLEVGVPRGPSLAVTLNGLRQKWKESRFTLTEQELIKFADEYKDYEKK